MIRAVSNNPLSLLVITQDEEFEIPANVLRHNCPCAKCRSNQQKAFRILDYDPKEIKILSVTEVGNYGVKINFSDGHSFGIFTFDHLINLSKQLKNSERF